MKKKLGQNETVQEVFYTKTLCKKNLDSGKATGKERSFLERTTLYPRNEEEYLGPTTSEESLSQHNKTQGGEREKQEERYHSPSGGRSPLTSNRPFPAARRRVDRN